VLTTGILELVGFDRLLVTTVPAPFIPLITTSLATGSGTARSAPIWLAASGAQSGQ
jgi:hypothetical protein